MASSAARVPAACRLLQAALLALPKLTTNFVLGRYATERDSETSNPHLLCGAARQLDPLVEGDCHHLPAGARQLPPLVQRRPQWLQRVAGEVPRPIHLQILRIPYDDTVSPSPARLSTAAVGKRTRKSATCIAPTEHMMPSKPCWVHVWKQSL